MVCGATVTVVTCVGGNCMGPCGPLLHASAVTSAVTSARANAALPARRTTARCVNTLGCTIECPLSIFTGKTNIIAGQSGDFRLPALLRPWNPLRAPALPLARGRRPVTYDCFPGAVSSGRCEVETLRSLRGPATSHAT